MQKSPPDPLEQVREAALQHLSQMLLWVFVPAYAVLFAINMQDLLDEPLRLPVYLLIPVVGVLLRPSPTRSLRVRGEIAVWSLGVVTALTLLKTGMRQPWATIAIVTLFALAAVLGGGRSCVRWGVWMLIAGVAGIVLREAGLVEPMRISETVLYNDIGALVIGFSACVFVGMLVRSIVRIYREAHAAQQEDHRLLLEAERKAQTLQRQEIVATMARGMAHDLANLLQVVNASVELMRDSTDDADRRELASSASQVATRASRSLRALLTVGRTTPGSEGTADIAAMFSRLETLLAPLVGARISVQLMCDVTGRVTMDEAALEQILLNLAFNARDAMTNGGSLAVHAVPTRSEVGRPMVEIRVQDTGHGIPPDLVTRIFDPYVTTKTVDDGTGLGLAIVQRAVEDAGGRVGVTSQVGVGTTFTVQLPVAA